ncbi:MAG: penicillin acylase family protein [Azospirillaceae bacterium]
MRRLLRWLWRIPAALLLLAAIVVIAGYFYLASGLPAYDRTVRVAGIDAPVQIAWDDNAVPHIFAGSSEDAYFALGFVHAQDRLWQMEIQRRLARGTVAELSAFGLAHDRTVRTLGLYRLAEASLADVDEASRRILSAYARGVNTYLANAEGAWPPEFYLAGIEPEPWTPADSLAWGRLMDYQLSSNWRREALRAEMESLLSPAQVDFLMPPLDEPMGATTLTGAASAAAVGSGAWNRLAGALPEVGPAGASNQWVLSGGRTATGAPLLVNDPHLGLQTPILWYLARIETPELTLVGATVPGVPAMVLGHNGNIAWGMTTSYVDTEDLVVERVDPDDPTRYLTETGSLPFETREEVIAVDGAEPVTITVRETRHGPVISDVDPEVAALFGPNEVVALASTGQTVEDTLANAIHRLNEATTVDEAIAALSAWIAPIQNFVVADIEGTVAFVVPGRIPVRENRDGLRPVAGWTGAAQWAGAIPWSDMPRLVDPADGQFVNANNASVGPDFPYDLGFDGIEAFRAARIADLLAGRDDLDIAASEAMLADIRSGAAALVLPAMLTIAGHDGRSAEALALLRRWDYAMDRNRPEPLIYSAWLRELVRALFGDELGASFGGYWQLHPGRVHAALTDAQAWCDDVRTRDEEDCETILTASLDTALDWIAARHGEMPSDWRWGDEHVAPLANQVIGFVPVISALLDQSIETSGSSYTVNRGGTWIARESAPFQHTHGAGFRAIYDLADPENSRFIIATGQSGHPLSDHYGDLREPWAAGQHVTIAGTPGYLAANGLGMLTLRPSE